MPHSILCLLTIVHLWVRPLVAHDLTGQWQGTLPVMGGLRFILQVTQAPDGKLGATFYNLNESPEGDPVKSVTLEGTTFRFDFQVAADRYEGTLAEDGKTITGKWYGSRHPGTFYPFDLHLAAGADRWAIDSSPHQTRFVTVADGVKLEVLDWGGTGRPLVFLAGLGNDAHIFDGFAPKFTPAFHVYGITRRGFGASSKPDPAVNGTYSADRLGDDVLAVIDALKLDHPVLAGHSIAGEELSSVGSRHPEKIAGLIYLDSGYPYAFYDRAMGDLGLDLPIVQKELSQLLSLRNLPRDNKTLLNRLLDTDLPQLTKSLERMRAEMNSRTEAALSGPVRPDSLETQIAQAIISGEQAYTSIRCPVLAIFAVPPVPTEATKDDPFAFTAVELASIAAQVKAFETGVPNARVVRIPDANHYVFKSNEADVVREMNDFLAKLP